MNREGWGRGTCEQGGLGGTYEQGGLGEGHL